MFRKRTVFTNNFGKELSATTLAGSFCRFGGQLFEIIFDSTFGERLWGTALWSRFGNKSDFEEQLCVTASNRSFENPQFWGLALEHNFGEYLSAATLGSSFSDPL